MINVIHAIPYGLPGDRLIIIQNPKSPCGRLRIAEYLYLTITVKTIQLDSHLAYFYFK